MTFRTRILLACLAAAAVPLMIVAAGARHVVRERLTTQYRERVAESSDAVRGELAASAATMDARLQALARRLVDDPIWRAALLDAQPTVRLRDYAPDAMRATGLDYLLLIDDRDIVLSSGHFRNDFDRALPSFAPRLMMADGPALVPARRAAGEFLALVRARSFTLGTQRFTLIGGVEIDSAFTGRLSAGSGDLAVTLDDPRGATAAARSDAGAIVQRIAVPFVDPDTPGSSSSANWTVAHSLAPLHAVVRAVDIWLLAGVAAALLLAFVFAHIVAARVTRPLEDLARKAGRVEIDRYDVQLATRRQDEVGSLSRLLDRMVQRLRAGAQQLREAERRATVGDMARQVNHDIRNGLLPIRNVIRHLTEVARDSPAQLGSVFTERAGTLQSGIGYLENLATNYARLTPRTERQPCDVNVLIQTLLRDSVAAGDDRVSVELSRSLPRASADPVALRRVLENLVINALESLDDSAGSVVIRTATGRDDDHGVVITVSDAGVGIAPDAVERIFDDFYTTKERGTGLGLSIVRRLVTDMGGRIRVQSEPDRGSIFTIDLPGVR